MKKDFKAALAAATTEAEVVRIVEAEVSLDPAPADAPAAAAAAPAAAAAATTTDAGATGAAGAAPAAAHAAPPPPPPPPPPRSAAVATAVDRGGPPAAPRRCHVVPDRHRHHLHGGRGPGERREGRRSRDAGRDPGLRRLHAPQSRGHRRRRCGDLRPRPPRQGRRPLRRKADGRRRGQEGDLRRSGAGRPGRGAGRGVEGRPEQGGRGGIRWSGRCRRRVDDEGRGRRRHPHEDPPVADDRGVLHDPVRRGGRHPHRPLLHVRADRAGRAGRHRDHQVQPDQ